MRRIPPERIPEILTRSAKGETGDQIAAWLATVGVKVSGRSIRKRLEATRTERADAAKVAVRSQLVPLVTSDLDELDQARKRAQAIEDATKDPELKLKALKIQAEILDKKLHYSGADSPDSAASATVGVLILPPVADD